MWRRPEPGLDWHTANRMIEKIMSIDAKVDRILELLEEEDDDEEVAGTDS